MKQRKFLIWYLIFHINHLIANAPWNMGKMCKIVTDFFPVPDVKGRWSFLSMITIVYL